MLNDAIRALLRFLRPYPGVLPAVAVLGTLASLAEGFGIGLMIPFLASLTRTPGVVATSGTVPAPLADGVSIASVGSGPVTRWLDAYAGLFPADLQLLVVAASIASLVVLSCLVSASYVRVLSWAAAHVTHDLRTRLFERFMHDDELFLDEGSQGRQVNTIDGAAYRVGQAVTYLCLLVVNACTVIVLLVLLALISMPMTAVVLLGVAAAALVVRVFVARGLLVSREYERRAGELADATVNALGSLRIVRMFGQEQREIARFEAVSDGVRQRQFRIESVRRTMAPLVDGIAAPLLVGGMVVAVQTGVSIAVLLPFLVLVFRLQRYARELDVSRVLIASNAGAVFDVLRTLDALHENLHARAKPRVPFNGLRDSIIFDGVSFSHVPTGCRDAHQNGAPLGDARAEAMRIEAAQRVRGPHEAREVLGVDGPSIENLTLEIRRGETLGIVGGSGAGKSTLINLLCGLHVPASGTIRVDGIDLNNIEPSSWRAHLGFAGQDAELRPGTVRENIAYGRPDASLEEVKRVARQVSAHPFIDALPHGYDTPVGVRGMQLSGGERQRVALARALLGRPDILILDEATNALDNTTEAVIRETLVALSGSLTMIVIAHRIASIRHADRVVVMEGGRIVEQGSTETLLERRGVFSELSRLERDTLSP